MTEIAASYLGVSVPASPFLNETRIERINNGRYEGQELAGALALVRPGDRVVEMGAGIGFVGAVVAQNVPDVHVLSFEANPALIPHIQELYRLNALQDRIRIRNQVVVSAADRPASVAFNVHKSFLGSSLMDIGDKAMTRVQVETIGFADLCAEHAPSVLIMDIEGGELEFLRHADLTPLRAVILELHPDAYGIPAMRECKTILRDAGFEPVADYSSRTVWAAERVAAA